MYMKDLILIADDNEEVLNYTALAVEMMGYEVMTCPDGEAAFSKTIIKQPGLIILDWKMPVMDGMQAAKLIRHHPVSKDIPIIMITGTDNTSELMAEALECGVNDFLRKPFVRLELQARIKSLLRQAYYMKQIIEIKNNELNNSAIQLAQAIELQNLTISHLEVIFNKTICAETKELIATLINKIKVADKTNPLDKLHKQFVDIHKDFVSNLLLKHSDLTPAEIKLSMLLRMNLDTKEIAALSFQTYDSVRVSRKRLREKLKLKPEDKLNVYLMQF
ncbi:MAG: Alkaline phosphatase synthesis transcriptional regulatory protein PhoP [Bacteroidetes bacterium ADurb.Bin408]|nr:MAG: Alkaline phosphatase synthesis transcriptional regulatory protein PhoP [Bacteroidetes bacterium ADurb.Bin408]